MTAEITRLLGENGASLEAAVKNAKANTDESSPRHDRNRPIPQVEYKMTTELLQKAVLRPLSEPETAVRMLTEITGLRSSEVVERLRVEQRSLGTGVAEEIRRSGAACHIWSDELIQFYESTDAFLFESLVWNRQAEKQEMRDWIADFLTRRSPTGLEILTYGDGLGFDSAHLARAGHRVTYFEVGLRSRAFAEQVFRLNDVDVNVVDCDDALSDGRFDVVVCLDVLEHVPDPPAMVRRIARLLRPGGRLVVHAPFWYVHPDVATHLRSNVCYSGRFSTIYSAAGLTPLEAHSYWNPIVFQKAEPGNPPARRAGALLRIAYGAAVLGFGRLFPSVLSGIYTQLRRRRQRCLPAWFESNSPAAANPRRSAA